jgi:glycosyltransferase involved in cell wall biosynthesis
VSLETSDPLVREAGASAAPVTRPRASRRLVVALCPGGAEASGGIGRMIAYLQSSLRRRPGAPSLVIVDTRGPHHIALAPLYFARALAQIGWIAARGRMGVLHVNLASNGSTWRKAVVVAMARTFRMTYIVHLHGADFVGFYNRVPNAIRRLIRWMFAGAVATVVLGDSWRTFAVEHLKVPAERVHVIYNGAPSPARLNAPNPDETPILLFLGRVDPSKGMPEIVEALARPEVRSRPWRVVAAGIGDIPHYQERAAELGIADRITFTGWVGRQTVEELMERATLLLLPSRYEGLPVAVIEAHAFGLPVIASPVGATAEIVRDGETGLLVPPGDVDALAAAIVRMLDDPALRRRLGAGGRRLFEERLDSDTIAGEFERLYAAIGRWS